MRIVRVTRSEYELVDGSIFPIIPELSEDITVEEFQKHYDNAVEAVRSSEKVGGDNSDAEGLGQGRED
jgi:hypothetical protein